MTTTQIFHDILTHVDLIAAAVVRQIKPANDLMSQRKAFEEFGEPFIRARMHPKGDLRPIRTGDAPNSPIKFSRTEILALIAAEQEKLTKVKQELYGKDDNDDTQGYNV